MSQWGSNPFNVEIPNLYDRRIRKKGRLIGQSLKSDLLKKSVHKI